MLLLLLLLLLMRVHLRRVCPRVRLGCARVGDIERVVGGAAECGGRRAAEAEQRVRRCMRM